MGDEQSVMGDKQSMMDCKDQQFASTMPRTKTIDMDTSEKKEIMLHRERSANLSNHYEESSEDSTYRRTTE